MVGRFMTPPPPAAAAPLVPLPRTKECKCKSSEVYRNGKLIFKREGQELRICSLAGFVRDYILVLNYL